MKIYVYWELVTEVARGKNATYHTMRSGVQVANFPQKTFCSAEARARRGRVALRAAERPDNVEGAA